MRPARLLRVMEGQLPVCRPRDRNAGPGQPTRLAGDQVKSQRRRVDDHEAVPAERRIDRQPAKIRNLQRQPGAERETRHVLDMDAFRLAVAAVGPDMDQPARRLQRQPRHRFGHRQDAAVEQHRRHADRVGTRHQRGIFRLHDDEAGIGIGMGRRHQQVDVPEHPAARLVQHEAAQPAVGLDKVAHLGDRAAGRRFHPVDDHIANLALGVAGQGVDGLQRSHDILRPSRTRRLPVR